MFPQIPGYKIKKKIGQSTLAEVYLGVQEDLDRQVVVKIMNPALFQDKVFAEKFIVEAKEDAKFVHPNIANILEVGETGIIHYIVMEHLPESLRDKINRNFGTQGDQGGGLEIERGAADFTMESPAPAETGRKFEIAEVLEILKQVFWALDYAHKNGVIHKNIRPENIRFREDGTPTVVDFFISKLLAPATKDQLKEKGITFGSPYYASPEQALRKSVVDGRTDIYSLGVVFYEMLTGQVPYNAEETIAIENQHIMEPIPQLPTHLKDYQRLLDLMMAKEVEQRAVGGIEFVQLIDELAYKLPPSKPIEQRKPESPVEQVPPMKPSVPLEEIPPMEQAPPLEEVPLMEQALPFEDEVEALPLEERIGSLEQEVKKEERKKQIKRKTGRRPNILVVVGAVVVVIAVLVVFVLKPFSSTDEPDITGQSQARVQQGKETPAPGKAQQKLPGKEDPEAQERNEIQFRHKFQLAQRLFANGDYQKAGEKLAEAEKFKSTQESQQLAEKIKVKLTEKKDHSTYKNALSAGTSSAMENYLQQFPSGFHVKEAEEKLTEFKKEEKKQAIERQRILAAMTKLRSQYKDLSRQDARTMLIERGFFEKYYNKDGDFKNHFVLVKVGNDKIVKDLATGLIWHQSGSEDYMSFDKTAKWLEELNQKGYAGYSDWRLPTLEEAASLIEKKESLVGLFIDPVFNRDQRYIWTGDLFAKTKAWAVDFFSGDVTNVVFKTNAFVRPVCSMR